MWIGFVSQQPPYWWRRVCCVSCVLPLPSVFRVLGVLRVLPAISGLASGAEMHVLCVLQTHCSLERHFQRTFVWVHYPWRSMQRTLHMEST